MISFYFTLIYYNTMFRIEMIKQPISIISPAGGGNSLWGFIIGHHLFLLLLRNKSLTGLNLEGSI